MTTPNAPSVILVVEDSPDDFAIFEFALMEGSVCNPVHHMEDGAAALDYILGNGPFSDRETYPLPDIVFLDINLPKIDGIRVLKRIRSLDEFNTTPVVMLTVSDSDSDVIASYELGSQLFIQKPVVWDNLRQLFESIPNLSIKGSNAES